MNRANRPRMSRISGSSYASKLMGRAGDGSTLSLDFTAMGGTLDPRITFTRASPATFINSIGLVEYAGSNLILQSENISSSPWIDQNGATRAQVSVTNPFGGPTCTQVTSGSASNAISQGPTYVAGTAHVFRIWVRAGTSSQLQIGVFAGGFVTGTISVISGTATVSDTGLFLVTGLTSTWTQLQIVYRSLTGSGSFLIYPDTASPVAGRTIYVWGAQLNPGSVGQVYYPTTTTVYAGARFDYEPTTLAAKGLQIEAPATNLLYYSQNGDPVNAPFSTWWAVGAGATVSSTTQTDPSNQTFASRCVLGTSTVGRVYNVQTSSAGVTYTFSFWAKSISGTTALFIWHFNSATGNFTAQTITTEWKRYSITILGRVGGGFLELGIANLSASAATVDIWGFQLETGSQASSYIATSSVSVTRAADTALMTGTNFSSWYTGNLTGTFVTEWFYGATSTTASTVIATCDVDRQHLHQYVAATTGRLRLANRVPVIIETANAITNNAINDGAFSYLSASQSLCLNNGTVATGTFVHSENPTWFSIGGVSSNGTSITDTTTMLNNSIRKIKYFPTRLSNAQLQALTVP